MANLEFWNDLSAPNAVWQKIVGRDSENHLETIEQAHKIFGKNYGAACLEVGAGVGRLLKRAKNHFAIAFGVDWSHEMVQRSIVYLADNPGTRVFFNDGSRYPFAENFFNFAYSFTCFQHMESIEMIRANIAEILRVLKPNAHCVIQTVMGSNESGRHDGFVFSSGGTFAVEFMSAGFIVDSFEVEGEWIWLKAHKPLVESKEVR